MSFSLEIKNLAIALEVLSRIQSIDGTYYELEQSLSRAIARQRARDEELDKPREVEPQGVDPNADDIPF